MSRRDHPLLEALGVTTLFLALVALAPGAVLTFFAEHLLRTPLDIGQRWTWAVATSVVLACASSLRSRNGLGGFARYMLLAAIAAAAVFVGRYGTHSAWASTMLREFVP